MKEADLLICNYHHFLDEDIRTNVLGWLDKGLPDVITIFDEAHNIESAARSHSSMTLTEYTLNRALDEIEANGDTAISDDARKLLVVLLETIRATYNILLDKEFGKRERIGKDWLDLRIADPQERTDMFRAKLLAALEKAGIKKLNESIENLRSFGLKIDAFYEKQFNEGKSPIKKICSSLNAAIFLSDYVKFSNDKSYYPILNVKRQNSEISGRLELFTCIPKNVTAPLFNSVHSAILMSATLAPFETIKTVLGIERDTRELSFGLTFPKEKRLTIAVSVPALFSKDRDNPQTKEIITKVLTDIIEQTDGNVLIFFPSFFEATQYKNRIQCDVPIFLDEVGVSAQPIRDEFFRLGESGKKAVLISYMWGTLTEGVDYKLGRGRTVVIVGVGYPALNDRTRAVESAYDSEFGHGWEYAIEIPTIRKVRQALGRVVRSPEDYGARVLLDGRYTSASAKRYGKYSVHRFFPEEERIEIIDVEPARVKYSLMNFFNDIRKKTAQNNKKM
jgi:DNA excision repair protein ERCC-2